MTNTPFSNQVDIVAEFYLNYGEEYADLVDEFDLGFPIAVAIWQGGVEIDSLSDKGRAWVTETFEAICEALEIDKHGEYLTLGDALAMADE